MDANEPHRPAQETQQNQTNHEEKEMKAKRKYYGKVFVALIFFVIIYVYYIYVYQIMWSKISSMSKNKINNLIFRQEYKRSGFLSSHLPPFSVHDALESLSYNEHSPWRDSFILGFLHRRRGLQAQEVLSHMQRFQA